MCNKKGVLYNFTKPKGKHQGRRLFFNFFDKVVEPCAKTVNDWKLLILFAKCFMLDVWLGSEYVSGLFQHIRQNLISWEICHNFFQYFKTFSEVPFSILLWTILVKLVTFHKKEQMTLLILYYLSEKYIQNWKTWLSFWCIFFTFNHNDKGRIHWHRTARDFPIKESYILLRGVWVLRPLP